ncbi:MAG: FecR domain-containing protein [Oligoflexia bacterium]
MNSSQRAAPQSLYRVSINAGLMALTLFCVSTFTDAAAAAEPAPAAGHIVSVSGKVLIRTDSQKASKNNSSAQIRTAKAGDQVWVGDVINTPSDGQIKILLKDRSILDLGSSSLFKINAFSIPTAASGNASKNERQVDSTIVYGSLRTAVTQKLEGRGSFKVRSPSATMGVRGTEFVVKSDIGATPQQASSSSQIVVLQGAVAVDLASGTQRSQNSALLTAGMAIDSSAKGVTPTLLDASTLAATASTARLDDQTFEKVLTVDVSGRSGSQQGSSGSTPGGSPTQEQRAPASSEAPGSSAGTASFLQTAASTLETTVSSPVTQSIIPSNFIQAALPATAITALPNPNELQVVRILIQLNP